MENKTKQLYDLERGRIVDSNTKLIMLILVETIALVIAQLTKDTTLFAVTMILIIYSWIFLGSLKEGKIPKVLGAIWLSIMVLMIGALLMMLNIVQVPENIITRHILGFPLPTAILFFVFWMFAGIANTAAYSNRFEKDVLRPEWLAEFEHKTNSERNLDNKEVS